MKLISILTITTLIVGRGFSALTCGTTERENCEECQPSPSENCEHCEFGYFRRDGGCEACFNGCEDCLKDDECISCKEGFYRYEAQIAPNPLQPTTTEDKVTCIICTDNCLSCKDGYSCDKCSPGFVKISPDELEEKNIPKQCPKVVEPDNKKDKRGPGELEPDSCCLRCQANCIECLDITTCKTCKPGYFLRDDGSCLACSDYEHGVVGCRRCQSGTNCTSCKPQYYLKNATFCASVVDNCVGARPDDPGAVIVQFSELISGLVCLGFVGVLLGVK